MRHVSWIVKLPLAIILVVFAVSNRQAIALDLWPLDIAVAAPVFVLVFGAAILGFLAGGCVVWVAAVGRRREARRRDGRIDLLEREVGRLQAVARSAAPASPPALTPPRPPVADTL